MEEKIKAAESAERAPEPAVVKPGAHAHKPHKVKTLLLEMWPAYLIEILVIILGISITLVLEEWRDNSKENHLAAIYQNNLLADIKADLHNLNYAIGNTQQLLAKGNELLAAVRQPSGNRSSAAQVLNDLQTILARPKFLAADATFSDLKSSGNLHLLDDIRLKNLLFEYYNQTQILKEAQDAEQQATIVISGPYFLKRFPLDGQSAPGEKDLQTLTADVEFGNNVLLRVNTRQELLAGYQEANTLALQLEKMLQKGR